MKIYKTKKRKEEFRKAYMKISDLNRLIFNYEIEIECFIRNNNWDEAISRQKDINNAKLELLEMGKQGWDIEYIAPQTSGYGVYNIYPELD